MKKVIVMIVALMCAIPPAGAMEIACNLDGVTDWSKAEPFVDVFKMSRILHHIDLDDPRDHTENKVDGKTIDNIPKDRDGWPQKVPFTLGGKQKRVWTTVLIGRKKEVFPFGTWTMLFEGDGEIRLSGLHTAVVTHDGNGQKVYSFEITESDFGGDDLSGGRRFNIYRSNESNPVKNIRLIRPGYYENDRWKTQTFTDEFLADHAMFTVVRMMDWNATNASEQTDWSIRRTENYQTQASLASPKMDIGGVAYEYQIQAANELNCDLWITLPHATTEAFHRSLATLVKNRLKPGLKCYIELSNEVWNSGGAFWPQYKYMMDKGKQMGFSKDISPAINKYYTYAAIRIFKVFDEVFGTQKNRLVRVLSGRGNTSTGDSQRILDALNDSSVNPDGYTPDAFAIAPYFGRAVRESSKGAALTALRGEIARAEGEMIRAKSQADAAGLQCITYEGGQHLTNVSEEIIYAANADETMYDIYMEYLNKMSSAGCELFNAFVSVGSWSVSGAWGHKQYAGEPMATAHKYRALYDYAASTDAHRHFGVRGGRLTTEHTTIRQADGSVTIYRSLHAQPARLSVLTLEGSVVFRSTIHSSKHRLFLPSFLAKTPLLVRVDTPEGAVVHPFLSFPGK